MLARCPIRRLSFESDPLIDETRIYAIINTPRSGSTFLADLLHSIGLGNPIEHMRPWVGEMFAGRPPRAFDSIRFVHRLIAFGRSEKIFGTKLISHVADGLWRSLTPAEASYIRELGDRATLIYLNRRNKLDQAISTLRAKKTGIWHSTDRAYRASGEYRAFDYDFEEIRNTLAYCVEIERHLADALAEHHDLIVVDYDELVANPAPLCRQIAERLGVTTKRHPAARVEKLADEASEVLARRFLSEAGERGMAITQFLDAEALLRDARRKRESARGGGAAGAGDKSAAKAGNPVAS